MQPPQEKHTIDAVATSTANDPKRAKRNSFEHKMRAQVSQDITRQQGLSKHTTRRPKPSMPPLPWDKSK